MVLAIVIFILKIRAIKHGNSEGMENKNRMYIAAVEVRKRQESWIESYSYLK